MGSPKLNLNAKSALLRHLVSKQDEYSRSGCFKYLTISDEFIEALQQTKILKLTITDFNSCLVKFDVCLRDSSRLSPWITANTRLTPRKVCRLIELVKIPYLELILEPHKADSILTGCDQMWRQFRGKIALVVEFGAEKIVFPFLQRMPERISHLTCTDKLALKLTNSLNLNLEYFNVGHIDNFDNLKAIFGLQNTERLQFEIAVDFKEPSDMNSFHGFSFCPKLQILSIRHRFYKDDNTLDWVSKLLKWFPKLREFVFTNEFSPSYAEESSAVIANMVLKTHSQIKELKKICPSNVKLNLYCHFDGEAYESTQARESFDKLREIAEFEGKIQEEIEQGWRCTHTAYKIALMWKNENLSCDFRVTIKGINNRR